jgi:hypothetical protein
MEFSVTSSLLLLALAIFSYQQLVSLFDYLFNDAPIIEKSWIDTLWRKSRTLKGLIDEAHVKVGTTTPSTI